MSARFEELDWGRTPLGEVTLRRRVEPSLGVDVYEVKLDDDFLMSSLFTVAEVELARLGLAAVEGTDLDVVVGGLGLGWTARAALADERVRSLDVVEALGAVVGWHERGLLPHAAELTGDPRTRLVEGDFFAMVAGHSFPAVAGGGSDAAGPARRHAVLVDIDHSPRHVLHPGHAAFYTPAGLRRLAALLHPGGVFALWSDEAPDAAFLSVLEDVFASAEAHIVPFANHLTGSESANTVYVASTATG